MPREAESKDPEETERQEDATARRLAEKVKYQKTKARENGTNHVVSPGSEANAWGAPPTHETTASVSDSELMIRFFVQLGTNVPIH